ncbi:MAG: iron chelate uptake ABC transporter family permease subunit [Rhodobacterales bacterium]|nr:iron chelate uptake ABC transporter family permease subunit [Rhodobacterales bacterium]MDX5501279.1 iron chelate uptake ABC transporter family permease subunit [Rhodobacterales bacterium]
MSAETRQFRIRWTMALLAAGAVLSAVLFLTLGAQGNWAFVLPFRGAKLAGLALVAVAVALATMVFQTLTRNRILTPSIMGFDALFVLIQTTLIFAIGPARTAAIPAQALFLAEVALLTGFAALLFGWLFRGTMRGLHLLLLVGIVFGTLFRAVAGLMQRLIAPDDFAVLQSRLFASFNSVDQTHLVLAGLIVGVLVLVLWRMRRVLDVLALGRDHAIGLGLAHDRLVLGLQAIVTVLVAVSTALVGPAGFFGLLVANLAWLFLPTARHAVLLPAAALIALICLIGGQTLLERVLHYDAVLSVVIEFVGGLLFLFLVIRGAAR